MCAQVVVQERRALFAEWMSKKSMRLAVLLGVLLTVSIAVNAMVLAFNFFLTEPRYTLAGDDPANIWAIGLLFVVGLIVSGVAFTSRRRALEAALLRRQAAVLQGYCRDLVAADNTKA